jgi:RNA polymerase sigma-70 factor, ECF subfamily
MSVERAFEVAQPMRASPDQQNGQHPDAGRRAALVDRAQAGDSEAFGLLYDEYQLSVYRYIYARVSSIALAEDLTSETFVRALRALDSFRWQGRDFGAWLVTIARNLITDHFKSGRVRLESPTDEIETHDSATQGPEVDVLTAATADVLRRAVSDLPDEQRDCLTMRFFAGMSIAETASALQKSEGAVKQLQLRAVRQLAKVIPKDLR